MCAGRGANRHTYVSLPVSLFSCSHSTCIKKQRQPHQGETVSIGALRIHKVSEQQDPVTGPDTVITSIRENSACLLEKSQKAAAQPQLPLWPCNGHRKGRTQPRRKEGERRFTPTTVDVSSVPHRADAVVFVQSLWDTRAPVLAWLGVTRV